MDNKSVYSGFCCGIAVFVIEVFVFCVNLIKEIITEARNEALLNSIPTSDTGNLADLYYCVISGILIFAGYIQGIYIGRYKKEEFLIGYVFGVVLMILSFGDELYNVSPTIVIGMIVSLMFVVIGFCLKEFNEKLFEDLIEKLIEKLLMVL